MSTGSLVVMAGDGSRGIGIGLKGRVLPGVLASRRVVCDSPA